MKPNITQCLLLLIVAISFIGVTSALGARIRFLNSMPQFGKATVRAIPPNAVIFNSTAGGVMTNYVNFTSLFAVFVTQYKTNVTALSVPYFFDWTKYYTLYTFQQLPRFIANVLVEDQQTASDPNKAALRSINLIQYNFDVDVFNLSNSALLFSNVSYGEVTPYVLVPPGDYVVYWETTGAKKRSINQFLPNISFDPFLHPGHTYTHWILPTGSFIVRDGSLDPLRKRTVETTSDQRLVVGKEKDAVTEDSVSNSETSSDSSKTTNDKSSNGMVKSNKKVNMKRRVTNRRK